MHAKKNSCTIDVFFGVHHLNSDLFVKAIGHVLFALGWVLLETILV